MNFKSVTDAFFGDINPGMKRVLIGILLFFVTSPLLAQDFSVGIAPYSFKFWGAVDGASTVSLDYRISFIDTPGILEPPII